MLLPSTHLRLASAFLALASVSAPGNPAPNPQPVQIEDIYRTDAATNVITLSDGRSAIYCRYRTDPESRAARQSLWRVDDEGAARPMEQGEPDAHSAQLSPDGEWVLFLSSRPFPDGTPAFDPVPPYSEPAADIWLIPVRGGTAIPLGGKDKPYGRVITDRFYGRVTFSPDGKRLAFAADNGGDGRTAEERRNNVIVVRDDQGEGYEGYGPAQIWVAELAENPATVAASSIRRITHDEFWYGDPQWAPDGSFIVVHANRTADQESARYSINRNFDLWKIDLESEKLTQLTTGSGPEFSPRISPNGKRVACLSSPRNGPHIDIFNLVVVELTESGAKPRVVFDHHAPDANSPPHLSPNTPLPDAAWRDNNHVRFNAFRGLKVEPQCVDVDNGGATVEDKIPTPARSPLIPRSNPAIGPRLRATDEVIRWKSFDGLEIEGILTSPPPSIAKAPYKLIVMPHGGPHHRASSGGGFDTQIFAMHGFATFQPNFRGSTGYGKKFLDANRYDFGGGDMTDILTGIDHLVKEGLADSKRQFVYGTSYGGFMTTWLVGHTRQFRAAVAQNSVTDLSLMWHLSDLQSWPEWEMGGYPWEAGDKMRKHSPLTYASQVRTPTLILHSLNDRRCPVAMGKIFHRALKEVGVETEMVIYPDEGHGIRQLPHREDLIRRILAWFQKHDLPEDR